MRIFAEKSDVENLSPSGITLSGLDTVIIVRPQLLAILIDFLGGSMFTTLYCSA